ncbi:TetR/AcrR family transcriptional regulator [Lederbergia citrea]|uniref:TetR/AcrR family transcriptional regulator n=1 Tax=Lederbergia citrea TaxID=2833581 RepID=UPI001BC927A4|nr:TetR/AcrR family transcriptional regulator [Lederbergia citrea]MBS4204421.1 TetR/AcrR family transcriptional regulator [Lederbergia citrea]
MKEKKRKEIIESAIKLFAENGFYNTSVQDIVTDCAMSKGAFYNYFSSKEELHIAIFQYYFEQMSTRTIEIDKENLNPREKMKKQLGVPFEELTKHKEFFIMYLREQSFSINKELREFMEKAQFETLTWYERNLKDIYGENITTFIGDIILLIEGMKQSYLAAMLFHDLQMDVDLLPNFLMNRIDDIVNAFQNGEEPIIKKSNLLSSFPQCSFGNIDRIEKASLLLADMQEQLENMKIDEDQRDGLAGVIDFLKGELKKPNLEKYAFQGMLANLKEIKEFDIYREKIAALLDVQLL